MARAHPPEFRRRAIDLAREHAKPLAQIAADIGISESCLRHWVHQADADEGAKEGLITEERTDLVSLRRENRVLNMEKEILAKAAIRTPSRLNGFRLAWVCILRASRE